MSLHIKPFVAAMFFLCSLADKKSGLLKRQHSLFCGEVSVAGKAGQGAVGTDYAVTGNEHRPGVAG